MVHVKSLSTELLPTVWAAPICAPTATAQVVVLPGRFAPLDGTGMPSAFADGGTPRVYTNASGTPTWSPPV